MCAKTVRCSRLHIFDSILHYIHCTLSYSRDTTEEKDMQPQRETAVGDLSSQHVHLAYGTVTPNQSVPVTACSPAPHLAATAAAGTLGNCPKPPMAQSAARHFTHFTASTPQTEKLHPTTTTPAAHTQILCPRDVSTPSTIDGLNTDIANWLSKAYSRWNTLPGGARDTEDPHRHHSSTQNTDTQTHRRTKSRQHATTPPPPVANDLVPLRHHSSSVLRRRRPPAHPALPSAAGHIRRLLLLITTRRRHSRARQ